MIENYNIYDTGYMPEPQYIMSYQIKGDNSEHTKTSKQKKHKKHGGHNNKHLLTPALVPHHHYHGASDHYSHGYYSDITGYPMQQELYGYVKEKKQRDKSVSRDKSRSRDKSVSRDKLVSRDKSASRLPKEEKDSSHQPKEEKESSYLGKFMTLGRKGKNKNKPKDNDDIYAIPRPSLVPGETIQRSGILRNMRIPTGHISERKGGIVNSKSMSNLQLPRNYRGTPRSTSSGSSEEIYESMEEIRSRKNILDAVKRAQCSRVRKTGHPLFDHLRAKSQENILRDDRSVSPQNRRSSEERIPHPVWPKADPYSKHAYHYIDDSSDIYSSSNDELEYRPEVNRRRIEFQHVPDYLQDDINDYDNVYSVPRFADTATRKFHQEMRGPEMRYH